jgi:hypothetical protein
VKKKKNCSRRFEAKKAAMPWEPPRGATTVPERAIVACTVLFWLFREINGDKVATNTHWFLNQLTINRAI